MKIDKKLITDGYVTERKHPECDYFIYNYTTKCQVEEYWTEQTVQCRGLILDGNGKIIAKPFDKFFNLGEHTVHNHLLGKIPYYNYFDVFNKMDGSLGILYQLPDGDWKISTRGSFESEQAIIGTEIWKNKYNGIKLDNYDLQSELKSMIDIFRKYTILFEIIYPDNKIVVDYGNQRDLILLGAVHKETGEEFGYEELLKLSERIGCPMTQYYGRIAYNRKAFLKVEANIPDGNEGFVLVFDNGLRVKVKSDEYVRLHRLITQCSTKSIWDLLRNGQGVKELLDRVPNDFYVWVATKEAEYLNSYNEIELECINVIRFKPEYNNRKELAEYIKKHKYPHILFAMIDEKPYDEHIWRLIRPEYSRPFKEEI